MVTSTDSELGRALLTERSLQWLYGHRGDPYARLLRDEEDDRSELIEQLRRRGPIYRSRTGAWVVGSHRLAAEVLTDSRLTARTPADFPEGHMLRQRAAVGGPSTEALGDVRGRVELDPPPSDIVERLGLAAVDQLGATFDLAADLLRPTMVALVAEMFAIPAERRESLGRWCGTAAIALDATLCPPRLAPALAMITAVRDLRSTLAQHADGDDDRIAAGMVAFVFGVEVATNLLVNAALPLLDHPDRWRRLGADPQQAEDAIAEAMVLDPPVRLHGLVVREAVELAGVQIGADSDVVVSVEAGQRDAAGQPDPMASSRATELCLAGPYLGPVASLVRTSAVALLRTLATALPELHRTGPVVRRLRAPVTHAVVRFPVAARRS
ncbi:P450-derived glycosyltransferase activator [Micromonospora chokoriensis]